VAATTASNPPDVIKTRVMNEGMMGADRAKVIVKEEMGTVNREVGTVKQEKRGNPGSGCSSGSSGGTRNIGSSSSSIGSTTSPTSSRTSGPYYHVRDILKNEGIKGFMRGWTASYCRIGPHTILSFLLIEKIRQWIGMATY
jgi:hypothetical protein